MYGFRVLRAKGPRITSQYVKHLFALIFKSLEILFGISLRLRNNHRLWMFKYMSPKRFLLLWILSPPKLHKESFNRRCSRESHSLTSETGSTWTTSWPILWGKQDRVAGHCAHSNPWLLDSSPTDTAWFWNNLTRETHSILKSTKILCISGRIIYSLFIYIYTAPDFSRLICA